MKMERKEGKYNPRGLLYKAMLLSMAFTIASIVSGEYVSGEKVVISGMSLSFLAMMIVMGVHQMYPKGYLGEVKFIPAIIAVVLPYLLTFMEFSILHFVSRNFGSVVNYADVFKVLGFYTIYAVLTMVYFNKNEVVIKVIEEEEAI